MADRTRKLTAPQVRELREWYERWVAVPKPSEVARKLGVTSQTVIRAGKGLTHRLMGAGRA